MVCTCSAEIIYAYHTSIAMGTLTPIKLLCDIELGIPFGNTTQLKGTPSLPGINNRQL